MDWFDLRDPGMLRDHLAAARALYQVVESPSGEWRWQRQDAGATLPDTGAPPPLHSAKQFLFAERENLFRFDGEKFVETLPDPEPTVLFGVRACDLTAIAYQDRFFTEDPYYQARRRATLLVGLDCIRPCEGGFCTAVDAGPAVREGTADLVLAPLGSRWLLGVATAGGHSAVAGLELSRLPDGAARDRDRQAAAVAARFPDDRHIHRGVARLNRGEVAAETWEALGIQCLACTGCTNLCPTCSCYATDDTPVAGGEIRRRFWDSCLLDAFQREASGHNPSASAGARVARFWYHKFSDDFAADFGRYGCVGCGRCEQTCPGVIGVHSVIQRIAAA